MTKRSFDDSFWGDPFVQSLNKDAKMLFAYLWTNKRCNSAGLYETTIKTISFETGISENDIPELFKILQPKVKWLPENNIVWVKNFLKHQPQSPLFLKSVESCLKSISANGLIKEFLDYNASVGVTIPYQYPIDTVTIGLPNILIKELDIEPDIDNDKELGDKVKEKGCFELPDWINAEVWNEYISMRIKIRKPATEYAKTLIVKKLTKLKESGNNPDEVLSQSISNSWQDVYSLRGDNNGKNQFNNSGTRKSETDSTTNSKYTSGKYGGIVQT
jgi:hypothetical protein